MIIWKNCNKNAKSCFCFIRRFLNGFDFAAVGHVFSVSCVPNGSRKGSIVSVYSFEEFVEATGEPEISNCLWHDEIQIETTTLKLNMNFNKNLQLKKK